MRYNIIIVLLALFVFSLLPAVGTTTVVYSQGNLQMGQTVLLEGGLEATYLGWDGSNYRFRTVIEGPQYLDNNTEIASSWAYDGKVWTAGPNLFEAEVDKEKVTVTKNGQTLSWDPGVSIGNTNYKAVDSSPTLLEQDPINENYYGNTLEWDYGICTRTLRIIEGILSEHYIFTSNPGGDVEIKSNLYKDENFIWDQDPFAYDAEGKPIEIQMDGKDKVVLQSEFDREDITYPIVVDPTTTFTTSAHDGTLKGTSTTYSTAHNAAIGYGDGWIQAGQSLSGSYYNVVRGFVFFDTSALPDSCDIDSAVLKLYGEANCAYTAFQIVVQEGMPTYPHTPLVEGDYLYSHYSGDGGGFASGAFSITGYNSITLNATGRGWVNKTGTTKFVLRSSRDLHSNTPTNWEFVRAYSYEQGAGYRPQLVVTFSAGAFPTVTTVAATDISLTTAKLHAYLDNDGGGECEIQFEYSNSSGAPYDNNTTWLPSNYTTGESPYYTIEGLNADDTYYFRVQASNDEGISNGSELSFDTLATLNEPSNFSATPRSSTEISLKWTKGSGSDTTYVVYKTGDYPTNSTDGTLAYNGTGGSYLLEGLSSGLTYYFKGWGMDAGDFSSDNATDVATTMAGVGAGDGPIGDIDTPGGFFAGPSITNFENLPWYDLFNDVADTIDIPRTSFWLIFAMGFAMILGAVFFIMTKSAYFAVAGVILGIFGGWVAGIFPGWILLVCAILVAFLAFGIGGKQNA